MAGEGPEDERELIEERRAHVRALAADVRARFGGWSAMPLPFFGSMVTEDDVEAVLALAREAEGLLDD